MDATVDWDAHDPPLTGGQDLSVSQVRLCIFGEPGVRTGDQFGESEERK